MSEILARQERLGNACLLQQSPSRKDSHDIGESIPLGPRLCGRGGWAFAMD